MSERNNNDSIEELARRLFDSWKGPKDIGNTYPHVKIFWLKLAKEMKIIEIESRIDEIQKVSIWLRVIEQDDRLIELQQQLNTLKGEK